MAQTWDVLSPGFNPSANLNAATQGMQTVTNLFERARKMRIEDEKAQQAQELHQLSVQSKQLSLQRDAQLFEAEKLKLQREVKLAEDDEKRRRRLDELAMTAEDDFEAFNSDVQKLLEPATFYGQELPFDGRRNMNAVMRLQQRLDALQHKYKPVLESGLPEANQLQNRLFSAAESLNPLATQISEYTTKAFVDFNDELNASFNVNDTPVDSRRKMLEVRKKFGHLALRDPKLFKQISDDFLGQIQELEKTTAEKEAAQIKLAASMAETQAKIDAEEKIAKNALSPGQKAQDEEFAKRYVEFKSSGAADAEKLQGQLDFALEKLERSDTLTGALIGNTPDFILQATNPEAVDVREAVQEVVQRNLRLILGAQFTAKEGEMLINRAYNPRLPEETNVRRVKALLKQMKKSLDAMVSMGAYFDQYGTLRGYQGSTDLRAMVMTETEDDSEGDEAGDILNDL